MSNRQATLSYDNGLHRADPRDEAIVEKFSEYKLTSIGCECGLGYARCSIFPMVSVGHYYRALALECANRCADVLELLSARVVEGAPEPNIAPRIGHIVPISSSAEFGGGWQSGA